MVNVSDDREVSKLRHKQWALKMAGSRALIALEVAQ
jgi:hypothetical protein